MAKASITIKDIARKLQISTSTVSRALRNQPDVNPETKVKVHEMAERLNYEPNAIALSLVNKKSFTIGVIVPSYHAYFYNEAMTGIEEYALQHGYHSLICSSRESYDLEKELLKKLVSKRVDGILVSLSRETKNYDHILALQAKNIPFVLFNRIAEGLKSSQVSVDDRNGALQAVNFLIQKGHRKIAHIAGPEGLLLSQRRRNGYQEALRKAGIDLREEWIVESDFSLKSGSESMRSLMDGADKPDAVFCVCDEVAYGAVSWLKTNGFNIPKQVGVIGFTGEPFAALIEPPLTTIEQPAYSVGMEAARILLDRIDNPQLPYVQSQLQTKLIERSSTL